jgi:2-keto-3-deoxy-L-rhamnonate aldolase RhmA
MVSNKLREILESEDPTFGTRVLNYWPSVFEVVGQTEQYDYVEFTAEYAPWDLHDLENISRATELVDLSSMIKIDGHNRSFLAQRALSAGFDNILFADVRDVEDARECVNAVRAEPEGDNGVRMDRRNGYVGGYSSPEEVVKISNDAVIVLMVEKKECLDNLDEILSVEGVDMVQFGPADHSVSLGKPGGRNSPEVVEAEETMIETALDMGVNPRAELTNPEDADWYLERGVSDFNLNLDIRILYNWWRENGRILRDRVASEHPH